MVGFFFHFTLKNIVIIQTLCSDSSEIQAREVRQVNWRTDASPYLPSVQVDHPRQGHQTSERGKCSRWTTGQIPYLALHRWSHQDCTLSFKSDHPLHQDQQDELDKCGRSTRGQMSYPALCWWRHHNLTLVQVDNPLLANLTGKLHKCGKWTAEQMLYLGLPWQNHSILSVSAVQVDCEDQTGGTQVCQLI